MVPKEIQQQIASLMARQRALSRSVIEAEDVARVFERDQIAYFARFERLDAAPPMRRQHPVAEALNTFHSTQVAVSRDVDQDAVEVTGEDEESLFIPEDKQTLSIAGHADVDMEEEVNESLNRHDGRRVTFAESNCVHSPIHQNGDYNSLVDFSPGLLSPGDDLKMTSIEQAFVDVGHSFQHPCGNPRDPFDLQSVPTSSEAAFAGYQDYVGHWDGRVPAGGAIEPLLRSEYEGHNARPDEVDSRSPCPYPDCGKMFETAQSVERHLRRDHPDWYIVMDQVNREAMY